jgi:hypothetical protein
LQPPSETSELPQKLSVPPSCVQVQHRLLLGSCVQSAAVVQSGNCWVPEHENWSMVGHCAADLHADVIVPFVQFGIDPPVRGTVRQHVAPGQSAGFMHPELDPPLLLPLPPPLLLPLPPPLPLPLPPPLPVLLLPPLVLLLLPPLLLLEPLPELLPPLVLLLLPPPLLELPPPLLLPVELPPLLPLLPPPGLEVPAPLQATKTAEIARSARRCVMTDLLTDFRTTPHAHSRLMRVSARLAATS